MFLSVFLPYFYFSRDGTAFHSWAAWPGTSFTHPFRLEAITDGIIGYVLLQVNSNIH